VEPRGFRSVLLIPEAECIKLHTNPSYSYRHDSREVWIVVISTLRLFPARDERRHVLAILRSVQGPTQAQPRCRSCQLYEEHGFDESILYLERWDSESDFERHVRSELYRRILAAVECSRKPPQIAFDYSPATKGMELIEALRQEGEPSER
jgi:quinol monooxygenase YgiN